MVIIPNWMEKIVFVALFRSATIDVYCSLSISFIYLWSGKHFSRKNLTKWVQPRGNWTYDLRLSTHPCSTTNATTLLSELRFEILKLVLLQQRGWLHVHPKSAVCWLADAFLWRRKIPSNTIPTFELWWELFRTLRL